MSANDYIGSLGSEESHPGGVHILGGSLSSCVFIALTANIDSEHCKRDRESVCECVCVSIY